MTPCNTTTLTLHILDPDPIAVSSLPVTHAAGPVDYLHISGVGCTIFATEEAAEALARRIDAELAGRRARRASDQPEHRVTTFRTSGSGGDPRWERWAYDVRSLGLTGGGYRTREEAEAAGKEAAARVVEAA